jgi:hypothetical protein
MDQQLSIEALDYFEKSMDEEELNGFVDKYCDVAATKEQAYEMFKTNLDATFQEVEANGFNDEQAVQLFRSEADLETGHAKVTEFRPADPDILPPPHSDSIDTIGTVDINGLKASANSTDISGRNNTDVTGIGYEVKSLPGYNRTTAYFYPGRCNINRAGKKGIAGYMFYTISGGGGTQDLGIVYSEGYWQPVVNGTWTGFATGGAHLNAGANLYFKIWIGNDQKIYFQGIDGNNFNNIIFQGTYSTWNMLPANGSGVTINRQITYAANGDNRKDHMGYYIKNACFDQAYLYSANGSYGQFTNSNTDSTRRGKFGTSWAPVNRVTINSNSHWYYENISIDLT